MLIRWPSFANEFHLKHAECPKIKHVQFLAVRLLLIAEFIFCCLIGHLMMWIAEFTLVVWLNQLPIVSGYDFEESETKAYLTPGQDCGAFQIKNPFDMMVVGNRYIDCFLTAGLGCHRVHHVLAWQKSGFVNIVSEQVVKETCLQVNISWSPTKNSLFQRFPKLFGYYLLVPMRGSTDAMGIASILREAFSIEAFKRVSHFIVSGFSGIGSI